MKKLLLFLTGFVVAAAIVLIQTTPLPEKQSPRVPRKGTNGAVPKRKTNSVKKKTTKRTVRKRTSLPSSASKGAS